MKAHEYYYLAKKNVLPDAGSRGRVFGEIKPGLRVHVSAVCGKAMASIACLLQEYGCIVTGSDSKFSPPMSEVLLAHNIAQLSPSLDNLMGIDLLVVGNALPHNALEVEEARKRNIPMISGAEATAQIFTNKRSLVVAGTHGKTTTSALLTHIFIEAGLNPAYMIGGAFQKSNESYSMGSPETKFVIYEGDEYNCAFFDQGPKFLQYNPTSTIITSIEQDHVDLYQSFEDYKQAFQFLIEELPADGYLVLHDSTLPYLNLDATEAEVVTYGTGEISEVKYEITKTEPEHTIFNLISKKFGNISGLKIPLFGNYNIENAIAVTILSLLEGLNETQIRKGLESFQGTRERQELLATKGNNIAVIRDYAHHPTAVQVTLQGLRQHYPGRRLIAVFEPKSASSRRRVFEERYASSLQESDVSIIIEIPLKESDKKENFLDAGKVKEQIESHGKKAYVVKTAQESAELLSSLSKPEDVIVFMSSGDLDGVPNKFADL